MTERERGPAAGPRGPTPLGYALLGVLARGDASGYDMARLMRRPVGFVWPARRNQLYPELAGLAAEGLVTFERVAQELRPDKKVYALTERGREALRRWATEPATAAPSRDEFLLKVYSLWLADPEDAIALVRARRRDHLEAQHRLAEAARALEAQPGRGVDDVAAPAFGDYATLQAGIAHARALAEWCLWLIDRLERGAVARSSAGGRSPAPAESCVGGGPRR